MPPSYSKGCDFIVPRVFCYFRAKYFFIIWEFWPFFITNVLHPLFSLLLECSEFYVDIIGVPPSSSDIFILVKFGSSDFSSLIEFSNECGTVFGIWISKLDVMRLGWLPNFGQWWFPYVFKILPIVSLLSCPNFVGSFIFFMLSTFPWLFKKLVMFLPADLKPFLWWSSLSDASMFGFIKMALSLKILRFLS